MNLIVKLILHRGGEYARGIAVQWLKADAIGRSRIEELHADTFSHYQQILKEQYSADQQGVEI